VFGCGDRPRPCTAAGRLERCHWRVHVDWAWAHAQCRESRRKDVKADMHCERLALSGNTEDDCAKRDAAAAAQDTGASLCSFLWVSRMRVVRVAVAVT
jgi:hypothetical protein